MNELEWLTELKDDIAKRIRIANAMDDPLKKVEIAMEIFSDVVEKITNRLNEPTSEEEK